MVMQIIAYIGAAIALLIAMVFFYVVAFGKLNSVGTKDHGIEAAIGVVLTFCFIALAYGFAWLGGI